MKPRHYVMAGGSAIVVLVVAILALILVASVVVLMLTAYSLAWLAWRFLPFRETLGLEKSPVQRLTGQYIAGHFDIKEFEQRLSRILHG